MKNMINYKIMDCFENVNIRSIYLGIVFFPTFVYRLEEMCINPNKGLFDSRVNMGLILCIFIHHTLLSSATLPGSPSPTVGLLISRHSATMLDWLLTGSTRPRLPRSGRPPIRSRSPQTLCSKSVKSPLAPQILSLVADKIAT